MQGAVPEQVNVTVTVLAGVGVTGQRVGQDNGVIKVQRAVGGQAGGDFSVHAERTSPQGVYLRSETFAPVESVVSPYGDDKSGGVQACPECNRRMVGDGVFHRHRLWDGVFAGGSGPCG